MITRSSDTYRHLRKEDNGTNYCCDVFFRTVQYEYRHHCGATQNSYATDKKSVKETASEKVRKPRVPSDDFHKSHPSIAHTNNAPITWFDRLVAVHQYSIQP